MMKGNQRERIEQEFQEALKEFPFLYEELNPFRTNKRQLIKYAKAIKKYPDLKELREESVSMKLALLAYDFREELLRVYATDHNTEMANARCDIRIGSYHNFKLPDDLPSLSFERECITCGEEKKGLNICQDCWQKIKQILIRWGYLK